MCVVRPNHLIANFSLGKSQMKQDPVTVTEYGACCILQYLFFSSTQVSPSANLWCHLYTELCCTRDVPLYMILNVSMSIIFADTQNFMALRMSFDGVTLLIFPISYQDLCAISDISNIKQPKRASDFKGTSTLACYDVN